MDAMPEGSILTPAGFRAGTAEAGIRTTPGQPDVALVVADGPAAAAGVFTQNRFAAAPVHWSRALLPADDARAVVLNAGVANACTGEQGEANARATAAQTARLLGCTPEQVLVASTGVIGRHLPMDRLAAGVEAAHRALGAGAAEARAAERAIMTTDTVPKACAVRAECEGGPLHLGGMAKGSGMIAPNMATMLSVVTTDAAVPAHLLSTLVRDAAARTFNRVTVDGDTSTNDSLFVLASGRSGVRVEPGTPAAACFAEALGVVLADLSRRIAADGEGATRLIEVRVTGAADAADADQVARAVAESQLVKCAVCGGDPNWGRIVCAAGYSGAEMEPQRTRLTIGEVCVFDEGMPTGADASGEMQGAEVVIALDLGLGPGQSVMLTCDLTQRYVEINAEYHT